MCDTFGIIEKEAVYFGKNSDREPNELQIIEHHPPKSNPKESTVKCSYVEIPQVEFTYGVLISRPFWMWGAEFGINEKGLVIGNEAVWTKENLTKKGDVLTGMDLLRLAIERAATTKEAIEVITSLLEKYGQGGSGGYQDKNFSYHNSFLICDGKELAILETANKKWAVKNISSFAAISNCLCIDESDYCSSNTKSDFSNKYSDWLYTTFSGSGIRRNFSMNFLKKKYGNFKLEDAFDLLKSHGKSKEFHPDQPLVSSTICAHAGNGLTRVAAQTTSSIVVEYKHQQTPVIWITATSSPCMSVFKPLTFDEIPGELSSQSKTLWIEHEKLHRKVLQNFTERHTMVSTRTTALQTEILDSHLDSPKNSIAWEKHLKLIQTLSSEIETTEIKGNFIFRNFWTKQNKNFQQEKYHSG